MPSGPALGSTVSNLVITPSGVMRPTQSWPLTTSQLVSSSTVVCTVNQRLPSGPATMPLGCSDVSSGYSVTAPLGVIEPTRPSVYSVNHTLPSGPAATPEVLPEMPC